MLATLDERRAASALSPRKSGVGSSGSTSTGALAPSPPALAGRAPGSPRSQSKPTWKNAAVGKWTSKAEEHQYDLERVRRSASRSSASAPVGEAFPPQATPLDLQTVRGWQEAEEDESGALPRTLSEHEASLVSPRERELSKSFPPRNVSPRSASARPSSVRTAASPRAASASASSGRELELAAKNEVLSRTAADLAAEVFRLKQAVVAVRAQPSTSAPTKRVGGPSPRRSFRHRSPPGGPADPSPQRSPRHRSPPTVLDGRDGCSAAVDGPIPPAEVEALAERQARFADRVRAETSIQRLKHELRAASEVIDAQRFELNALHGRRAALKVANEAALLEGAPWDASRASRLHAASKVGEASVSVTSEDLRDLLDLAVLATGRQVEAALGEAAKARAESERAAADGAAQLETSFHAHDPARVAARALLVQSNRAAARMRDTLHRLEETARHAQSVNAADIRSLSARLRAQRDSLNMLLVRELNAAETEGPLSIRGLRSELDQLHVTRARETASRDDQIAQLQREQAALKEALAAERTGRATDNEDSAKAIAALKADRAQLSDELAASKRTHADERRALTLQLSSEGADADARLEDERRCAEEAAARVKEEGESLARDAAMERQRLQTSLEEVKEAHAKLMRQKAKSEAALKEQLDQMTAAKSESEAKLNERLRKLEALKLTETTMLKSRIERLSKLQDASASAGGAKARSLLYMEAVKAQLTANRPSPVPSQEGGGSGQEPAAAVAFPSGEAGKAPDDAE